MTYTEEQRKKIGKALSGQQERLGYTLYRIVKESGLQYNQVRGILSGKTAYSIDSLLLIANSLRMELKLNKLSDEEQ